MVPCKTVDTVKTKSSNSKKTNKKMFTLPDTCRVRERAFSPISLYAQEGSLTSKTTNRHQMKPSGTIQLSFYEDEAHLCPASKVKPCFLWGLADKRTRADSLLTKERWTLLESKCFQRERQVRERFLKRLCKIHQNKMLDYKTFLFG